MHSLMDGLKAVPFKEFVFSAAPVVQLH